MLKKTPIQGSDKVAVTFEMEPQNGARSVHLAGDFNEWDPTGTPMKQRKDGRWATTIRLPRAGRYQYRYVVDGQCWVTDHEADGHIQNEYGEMNAVAVVS